MLPSTLTKYLAMICALLIRFLDRFRLSLNLVMDCRKENKIDYFSQLIWFLLRLISCKFFEDFSMLAKLVKISSLRLLSERSKA